MRAAYTALSHSIAGLVAVQAALIALATAGLLHWVEEGNTLTPAAVKSEDTGATGAIGFALHSGIGMILIPLLDDRAGRGGRSCSRTRRPAPGRSPCWWP